MARYLSPKTIVDEWNYNLVLWRSSQLFVCSFAYTLLSVLSGTRTAFRAMFFDGDNTMWSSFRSVGVLHRYIICICIVYSVYVQMYKSSFFLYICLFELTGICYCPPTQFIHSFSCYNSCLFYCYRFKSEFPIRRLRKHAKT